jgi:hypothetical protein
MITIREWNVVTEDGHHTIECMIRYFFPTRITIRVDDVRVVRKSAQKVIGDPIRQLKGTYQFQVGGHDAEIEVKAPGCLTRVSTNLYINNERISTGESRVILTPQLNE